MKNNPPKSILIVKLSAIGDVLMATPVAAALRKAFPDSHISWIVERKSADVVIGNPYLDDVIVWDRMKVGGVVANVAHAVKNLIKLDRKMHSLNYDVALDFQGLIRSASVCMVSGAKKRIGFSDAGESAPLLYHQRYKPAPGNLNAQQRNLDLLKTIGVESTETAMYMPLADSDREFADNFFKENNLANEKVIAFLPATTWVNKHWVEDGWSELADVIAEKYGAKSLIFGSKADVPMAERITGKSVHKSVIAAGKTTLKQAGALMEKCAVVVGVDTGLLHMAVALDRPSIGLFGASVWRCFIKKDNFIWISKDFDCSPCLRHPTCKDVDCMRAITPADIDEAIGKLL